MSEALKSNTALTALKYRGEDKKKEDTHKKPSTNHTLFFFLSY